MYQSITIDDLCFMLYNLSKNDVKIKFTDRIEKISICKSDILDFNYKLPINLKYLTIVLTPVINFSSKLPDYLEDLTIINTDLSLFKTKLPKKLKILNISANRLNYVNLKLPSTLELLNISGNLLRKFDQKLPTNLKELNVGLMDTLVILTVSNKLHMLDIKYTNVKKLKLNFTPKQIYYDCSIKNKKTFDKKSFYILF